MPTARAISSQLRQQREAAIAPITATFASALPASNAELRAEQVLEARRRVELLGVRLQRLRG